MSRHCVCMTAEIGCFRYLFGRREFSTVAATSTLATGSRLWRWFWFGPQAARCAQSNRVLVHFLLELCALCRICGRFGFLSRFGLLCAGGWSFGCPPGATVSVSCARVLRGRGQSGGRVVSRASWSQSDMYARHGLSNVCCRCTCRLSRSGLVWRDLWHQDAGELRDR